MPLAIAVEKIKAIIHFVSIRQSVADSLRKFATLLFYTNLYSLYNKSKDLKTLTNFSTAVSTCSFVWVAISATRTKVS